MSCYAVVLAGGSGRRMDSEQNKVFLPLRGIPAIVRALAPFTALCAGAVVVARKEEMKIMGEILRRFGMNHFVRAVAAGGEDRQASVWSGLAALPEDAEVVLIHDGARALVTESVIQRVLESVEAHGSGVAAIPVTDTIKRAGTDRRVEETLDRAKLFAMQTPQGFRVNALRRAHEKAEKDGFRATDDAALLEYAEQAVYLCEGDRENLKLTMPLDLTLAEMILAMRAEKEML